MADRGPLRNLLAEAAQRGHWDSDYVELLAQEIEGGCATQGGPAERARILADRVLPGPYGTPPDLTTAQGAVATLRARALPHVVSVMPAWTQAELLDLAELVLRLAALEGAARALLVLLDSGAYDGPEDVEVEQLRALLEEVPHG